MMGIEPDTYLLCHGFITSGAANYRVDCCSLTYQQETEMVMVLTASILNYHLLALYGITKGAL